MITQYFFCTGPRILRRRNLSQMSLLSRLHVRVLLPSLRRTTWASYGREKFLSVYRSNFHVTGFGEACLSGIRSNNGLRMFSVSPDLSMKKCVPCNSEDLQPMTEDAAKILIEKIPRWNLVNEEGVQKLQRSWKVKSFKKGMEFLRLIADVAEAEGHHPDLHLVEWNNVKIEIWTHAAGGLTENDFILAAKINGLDLLPLLRKNSNSK